MIRMTLVGYIVLFSFSVIADENKPTPVVTKVDEKTITLNAANLKNRSLIYSGESQDIKIRLINIVPTKRYYINFYPIFDEDIPGLAGLESINFAGVRKGTQGAIEIPEAPGDQPQVSGSATRVCKNTKTLIEKIEHLYSKDVTEDKVANFVHHLESWKILHSKNIACQNWVNEADKAIQSTILEYEYKITKGSGVRIEINTPKAVKNISLKPYKKTRWMTHLGFTFVANQGESYYSKKIDGAENESDTYQITRQHSEDKYLYSATGLWTYPSEFRFIYIPGTKFGWTAGLGANTNNIFVLTGPSVIIGDNILINFGAVFQQFDQLKGEYMENEDIGETPIDSGNLVDKTVKPSWAISIGYRFGN